MRKVLLGVRLEPATLAEIERRARKERREKSEVARLIIEDALHPRRRTAGAVEA